MHTKQRTTGLRLGVAALLLAPLGGLAQTYTLTDLGLGSANSINNSGKVVGTFGSTGWYYDGSNRSNLAFQLLEPGVPVGPPPYNLTAASGVAISDGGRIIGQTPFGFPPPGELRGYVYDGSGVGLLLTGSQTPYAVNTAGVVAGSGFTLNGSTLTPLAGTLPVGTGINDSGVVVGSIAPGFTLNTQSAIFGAGDPAVIDTSSIVANLPNLSVNGSSPWASTALGVNNSGTIIGRVYYTGGAPGLTGILSHGYVYANGGITDLGTLGGKLVQPRDIDNTGRIVGSASLVDDSVRAFIYRNGAPVDLNSLLTAGGDGWTLTSANGINDSGVIVGTGFKNGEQRAFLLTPSSNNQAPSINIQPQPVSVFENEPFSLSVTAAGPGTLTYQWKHAGTNLPAATDRIYKVDHATAAHAGEYQVVVTNDSGGTPSDKIQVEVKLFAELSLNYYAGITLKGAVGKSFLIQAVEDAGDTNWQTIDTVTLTTSPFFWVDPNTPQHHRRLYRAVAAP